MMSNFYKWHLPEGVQELLPPQAERLEACRRLVLDQYRVWGYDLVMPPMIDFLDALLVGAGQDLAQQTFNLVDQVSGLQLGLRADMTPQVARIDAHRLQTDQPVRLCYCDAVIKARASKGSQQRTLIQTGVELFGHQGIASDLEVLSLLMKTLELIGFQQTHLDLGHVGVLEGLLEPLRLSKAQTRELLSILRRKSLPDLQQFIAQNTIQEKSAEHLLQLIHLQGDVSILTTAQQVFAAAGETVRQALEDLQQLAQGLARFVPAEHLYFDLTELRGFRYHTGVVFAAYVPGFGQAIAKGGRYDQIGKAYGRARPATGFSLDLLQALNLLSQPSFTRYGIYAPALPEDGELQTLIEQLRLAGERVIVALGANDHPQQLSCDRHIIKNAQAHWQIEFLPTQH
jgi:ATP phosphoribosyltransferase regulatory subunit